MNEQRDAPSGAPAPSNHRKLTVMSDDAAERRSKITEGTVAIVAAYVANNRVPHSELPALVALVGESVTGAVGRPRQYETSPIRKATEGEIQASIKRDRLISFVDGKPYKTLRRHLRHKGFSPQSYRSIYGLPFDYPMVAPSYSERRSEISREIHERKSPPAQGEIVH